MVTSIEQKNRNPIKKAPAPRRYKHHINPISVFTRVNVRIFFWQGLLIMMALNIFENEWAELCIFGSKGQ